MKKLMMMAVVGLGVLAAHAGAGDQYFYWNVSESENPFSYAKLAYSLNGGASGYFTIGDTPAKAVASAAGGTTTANVFANFGAHADGYWSDYAFQVEAYNSSGDLVASSSVLAFGDILGHLYDYEGFMDIGSGVTPLGVALTGVAPVPEPTSALLLLMGLAGLALRRRNA